MPVTAADVKGLREKTGAGVMECKGALEEAQGNVDKAIEILKQRGLARAEKKAGRVASQGLVECYIHAGGRIGALVEVNCETDFVARTDQFKELAHSLAMQVAATAPCCVSADEMPAEGDPAEMCLLAQPFIKDPSMTVQDLIKSAIASTGENIKVRRFARFELGN
ncbi:MAG: translation elongation factor Ts [Chloroflexi bacterium]|nr:translation elongation factor Ts [Chloroflexota bacterium]